MTLTELQNVSDALPESEFDLNSLYAELHGELPPDAPASGRPRFGLLASTLEDVKSEPVEWLWEGRLPIGRVTVLVGAPSAGKTFLTMALAAAFSNGADLPGHPATGFCESLIIELEDSASDTLKPRAVKCGATLDKIHVVDGVRRKGQAETEPFSLTYIDELERFLTDHPAVRFVVINPLSSAFDASTNDWRETDVRRELGKLERVAREHRLVLLVVKHYNKSDRQHGDLNRIAGSIAFGGAVRCVLGIEQDLVLPERRVLHCLKNNLGRLPAPVVFEINDEGLQFLGEETPGAAEAAKDSALTKCVRWLHSFLSSGPIASSDVLTAARTEGFAARTLARARALLRVERIRHVNLDRAAWYMALPASRISGDENDSCIVDGDPGAVAKDDVGAS